MQQTDLLMTPDNAPEWDLSSLYLGLDDPAIASDCAAVAHNIQQFTHQFQPQLSETIADDVLLAALTFYEKINEVISKLSSYAELCYYKNALDPAIVSHYQSTKEKIIDFNAQLLFFDMFLQTLPDSAFEYSSLLSPYIPYLKHMNRRKPHTLSHDVENVLLQKSLTARLALVRLYDETMARLVFVYEGESCSLATLTTYLSDKNPVVRHKAALCLSETLAQQAPLFTFIMNTLVKDKEIEDTLRHYPSPQTERHLSNDITADVVERLVASVKKHYYPLAQRYYTLKGKELGITPLNYWDRNAPLDDDGDESFTFLQSQQIVLEAFDNFSPRMKDIASQFFDKQWIDVPTTQGKTDGAFSHPTVPSANPFILLNFQGKKRDVMTLAHELGHGIHQILAAKQGFFLSDTPLTLAETASIFAEMLTFHHLIKKSPTDKKRLLAEKIEDMINTIVRQIAFHEFEVKIHDARQKGELTHEDINHCFYETQKEALGDSVHLDPLVHNYWSYITHFIHSPFYVYSYAFGNCFVNSLYKCYQTNPETFLDHYIALLEAGGSLTLDQVLKPFDLDSETLWDKGADLLKTLIDDYEACQ